jgi:transglutaminase-like putative cysteine protease
MPEHSMPTDYIQKNNMVNGWWVAPALQTNEIIISTAQNITKDRKTKESKAKAIYKWIIDNTDYVYIDDDCDGYPDFVGAEFAFDTGMGICYDYATLYMVMCDAVNLNVRLIGGDVITEEDGWVGHAWNQIQIDDGSWLNVDATWGEGDFEGNFGFKEYAFDDEEYFYYARYNCIMLAEFENY